MATENCGKPDDKPLIEDYLAIEALNTIAEREKRHRKHPAALIHYGPARRLIRSTTPCRPRAAAPSP